MGHPTLEVTGVIKWLCMLEFVQTTTPMWGNCHWSLRMPTMKIFACTAQRCGPGCRLLQFWQDHMTIHLFGGCFYQTSDLVNTLIRGHQHVDAPLHPIRMDLHGEACLPVARHTGSIRRGSTWRSGKPRSVGWPSSTTLNGRLK